MTRLRHTLFFQPKSDSCEREVKDEGGWSE